jgi:hypothetical protein
LSKVGIELKDQSSRTLELLETFKEVSTKLDDIPSGNEEQAKLLANLSEKMDVAVKQEEQMQHNMETLGEVLKAMNEFTKEQAESLEAIQSTTREAIRDSMQVSEHRFKITAALLAALIGLILILGIIAIVRLPG